MIKRRMAQTAAATAMAGTVALAGASDAFAWHGTWKTDGSRAQVITKAHHVKAGQKFLHFGIKGKGDHTFTARAYKVVPGKGGSNDRLVQQFKWKDTGSEYTAPFQKYTAGDYYLVLNYGLKGKKAYGGID
ncbi:hypothetical protein [Streptomyces decoyicus]|uniref:hypothetical protein n=1 Tax=Streptomyces decoyicus TaxID=249567 RepID=UPI000A56790C|nr:hypothetical protein [Streptomyces decoyicus]QZY18263.1 hypothetical protein K7C20_25930 [Streptomyces decoyicus]